MEKKNLDFDPEVEKAIRVISQIKPTNFSGCIEIEDFNKNDWNALHQCNLIIDGATRYGIREEELDKGTHLFWSNNARRWFVSGSVNKGEKKRLDANEVICFMSPQRAKRVACWLKELPLYYASTEARIRDEINDREALDIFAEGKGIGDLLENLPKEEQDAVRKEIRKKGWKWFFGG